MVSEEGALQGASNNAANMLLQSANTDWVIESKLELNRKPVRVGEQGGIIAYQDDDNYVKLILTRASGGFFGDADASIELAVEHEGSQNSAAKIPVSGWMKEEGLPTVVLKLEKKGNTYTASYSGDGSNFKKLGSTEIVLSDIQAGVIVSDGIRSEGGLFAAFLSQQNQELEPMTAKFDYFRIENTGSN
ncbi:MAG: beta-xylosidase family glycoside hydrolase [Bacteroidales bacterium]